MDQAWKGYICRVRDSNLSFHIFSGYQKKRGYVCVCLHSTEI